MVLAFCPSTFFFTLSSLSAPLYTQRTLSCNLHHPTTLFPEQAILAHACFFIFSLTYDPLCSRSYVICSVSASSSSRSIPVPIVPHFFSFTYLCHAYCSFLPIYLFILAVRNQALASPRI
ncbi:hypothetical protein EDB89DRAFT_2030697 [Lactarius sanguifluus]|nr:hypothetical protein EDB89DRAFT_2030697 [Lactarius sanguifluus]